MSTPLAQKMRPKSLNEFLGQTKILGPNSLLLQSIQHRKIPSMIFWGPPGCGKTSLASLLKNEVSTPYFALSAVQAGIKDVKKVIEGAHLTFKESKQPTLLFIDEIHRFNKSQQDALLKAIEEGPVTLIGATTENPSFEVNKALLSRCHLMIFESLNVQDLINLGLEAVRSPQGLNRPDLNIDAKVLQFLGDSANGDARFLLNQIELLVQSLPASQTQISLSDLEGHNWNKALRYDKQGEEHYNLTSVFHKSIRGSDPQAAIYWLHRMLAAGAEPRYLLRRLIRIAMEDVGNADPQALPLAISAQQAFDFLGIPEGLLALDQITLYLATAPKSNRVELAHFAAQKAIQKFGDLTVPLEFRNAPSKTMKDIGYGKGYQYDHDSPQAYAGQEHLPRELAGKIFYTPTQFGFEKEISKRMQWWQSRKIPKE